MLGTLLLGGIIGVIVASIASFIALKLYGHGLQNTIIQQHSWERAQEVHQQQWQIEQEKRASTLEKSLSVHVQQVQQEWQAWKQKDALREQELKQQYEAVAIHTALENEMEHVPYLEEASLPPAEKQRRRTSLSGTIPAQLQGADLTGRDLSRRYLGGANLRGATLAHANLFMTDLSGACLAGADLTGADLSGANLMHTDLREATLVGANVLVADLNDAVLLGTKLQKIRNLTAEQVITTVHDNTTQFDEENDITLPRIPSTPKLALPPSSTSQPATTSYDIVRAQSLNAIPETPISSELEQQAPISSLEVRSDETSLTEEEDIAETDIPAWTPTPSNETLRLLEELHLPTQESRSTENFGMPEKRDGRSQVRAS